MTYTKDQDSSDNVMAVSYSAGALSLSLTAADETGGGAAAAITSGNPATITGAAGVKKTTIGATYVTGPYTIAISGDDQAAQDWDASVAMTNGGTTITVAADETEIALSYTDGALTFGAAMDSGQTGLFGDEAETVISAGYTDGDVTVAAKGTDQDEMEVSVTFAF